MKAELSQAGVDLNERDFFAQPFTLDELKELIGARSASDYFSWRSPSFRKLGLSRNEMTEGQMLDLMLGEPRLIRRPLIQTSDGDLIVGADKKAMSALLE